MLTIKSAIKSRGWGVDLYAIEVGFCSRSLLCCLWNLGFNILAKKPLKPVSKLSMESSFCIWLARHDVVWQSVELNSPVTNTTPEASSPSITKANIKINLPNSPTPSKLPVGFISKRSTCYANTILRALSVTPILWRTFSAESAQLSPLLKSIALNMAIKEKSAVRIDPLNFLWTLKHKISSSHGAPFDFNSQQYVAEYLQVVFDELKATSIRTDDLLSNTLRTTITCNSCFCSAVREEKLGIVSLPMADNVNSSVEKFLSSELLTLENEWFCPSCNSCKECIKDTSIIQSAPVLVIHLNCFCVDCDKVMKDDQFFKCFPEDPLQIRITHSNEVSFFNNYSLVATINHSGSLNNGHSWAIVRDDTTNQWFSCNDKVVFQIKANELNNKTSYVLFFVRK